MIQFLLSGEEEKGDKFVKDLETMPDNQGVPVDRGWAWVIVFGKYLFLQQTL